MSTARSDLLARAVAFVAENGMSDLSLRELAAGIGTSHRMLCYHFENRDGLVAAIVESVERQQRAVLEALAGEAATPRAMIEAHWAQLSDPALRPFVVLFFEALALALRRRPGTAGFLDGLTEPWLALASGLAGPLAVPADRDELRLAVAVVRGLLLEVAATGDAVGPTSSLRRYLDVWDRASAAS